MKNSDFLLSPDQQHKIAAQFIVGLQQELGPITFEKMVTKHITDGHANKNTCVSHDYCDANMVYAEAFERVTGKDLLGLDNTRAWAPWSSAKKANFDLDILQTHFEMQPDTSKEQLSPSIDEISAFIIALLSDKKLFPKASKPDFEGAGITETRTIILMLDAGTVLKFRIHPSGSEVALYVDQPFTADPFKKAFDISLLTDKHTQEPPWTIDFDFLKKLIVNYKAFL